MRMFPIALVGALVLLSAAGCADENFTRDVEARWCELTGADCAPPPPLRPPLLNQPDDGYRPAGPGYLIPPNSPPPTTPGADGR